MENIYLNYNGVSISNIFDSGLDSLFETIRTEGTIVRKDEILNRVISIISDPVERFQMLCGGSGKTVDEHLDRIDAGRAMNFYKNNGYELSDGNIIYKFPSDIEDIAIELGIDPSSINLDERPKAELSDSQLARVQQIYSKEIEVYESLVNSGEAYVAPATEKKKQEKLDELKKSRDEEYLSVLTTSFGIQFKTDLETIIDIQTIISLLADGDEYSNYKTANGEYHNISKEEFSLAIAEGVQRKSEAFAKEYLLSLQVQQATTLAELESINW